jgi:hypothetical protein
MNGRDGGGTFDIRWLTFVFLVFGKETATIGLD